jgi:hypothetical protein
MYGPMEYLEFVLVPRTILTISKNKQKYLEFALVPRTILTISQNKQIFFDLRGKNVLQGTKKV